MIIDLKTMFILFAVLNLLSVVIFTVYLFSIKEKSCALIIYIIANLIVVAQWYFLGSTEYIQNRFTVIFSNSIVYLGIGYSLFSVYIANTKFSWRKFILLNIIIALAILIFLFFSKYDESFRIVIASLLTGILFLVGSFFLIKQFNFSRLQGLVGLLTLILAICFLYRSYYAYKINPTTTLLDNSSINSLTFLIYYIASYSVAVIILMIHIEESKKRIENDKLELKAANATKDTILSVIAHDLKNYFNSILGLSAYLTTADRNTKMVVHQKYISLIHANANSAHQLMENLLIWANTQTHRIVFEPKNFFLKNTIDEVVAMCKPVADLKDIEIEIECSNKFFAFIDENMFHAILRNLILNAIKFSYSHSKVQIEVKSHEQWVYISIIDQGIGLNKQMINYILTDSGSESKPGTAREPGNGMGLQICKDFIRRHKGKLTIESVEGKGSCFTFSVPQINVEVENV